MTRKPTTVHATRRTLRPAGRGLAGAAALAAIVLLCGGCGRPSEASRLAAARALEQARQSGANEAAPGIFAAAEEAFAEGLSSWKNEAWERADAAFVTSARRAALAERILSREQRETSERAMRLLTRARSGVQELEWLSTYLPPRSPVRSSIMKASVGVKEAATLFDQGDAPRSLSAARQASQEIASAYERFGRFLLGSTDPDRIARYRKWVEDTVSWSRKNRAEAIIVDKMRRTLTLVSGGRRVHTYRAELGINGTLVKIVSGDRATPEGRYKVVEKRGPQQTRWYKALLLNYPNDEDLKAFRRARKQGRVPRNAGPGSLIEIHGKGGRGGDWTDGCVALSNGDMDHLFGRVGVGTPVTIVGFEVDDRRRRRNGATTAFGAGG
jgi:lipoprotein-anchoring transpeptidase ErfK/SrfK